MEEKGFLEELYLGEFDKARFDSFTAREVDPRTESILERYHELIRDYPPDRLEEEGVLPDELRRGLNEIGIFGLSIQPMADRSEPHPVSQGCRGHVTARPAPRRSRDSFYPGNTSAYNPPRNGCAGRRHEPPMKIACRTSNVSDTFDTSETTPSKADSIQQG